MVARSWLVATSALVIAVGWLALSNRELRAELAKARAERSAPGESAAAPSPAESAPVAAEPSRRGGLAELARAVLRARPTAATPTPEGTAESRMQRRASRTQEIAALLGRLEGEPEDDYRERVLPLLSAALERPRQRALEMRRVAEQRAGVTPEQSAKLDKMFAAAYDELLDYTNAAILEGQLSPYQRNVSGWLSYAGGLGGILGGVEASVGGVLRPEQVRALADSGFEWGEFLGVSAPWEKLRAPPPPRD